MIMILCLIPAITFADINGAVAENKWLMTRPTPAITNQTTLNRVTDRHRPGRSLYWPVVLVGAAGNENTIQQVNGTPTRVQCTIGGASDGCASAPLFISGPSARVCVDADLASSSASGAVVDAYTCKDSNCLRTESVRLKNAPILDATDASTCFEVNGSGGSLKIIKAGGMWVYFDLSAAATNPIPGKTLLVSVTGR